MVTITYSRLFSAIHPLLFTTISLMLGIGWYHTTNRWQIPVHFYYAIVCLLIICTFILHITEKKRNIIITCLSILFFFIGAILLHNQHEQHKYINCLLQGNKLQIKGTIQNITHQPHVKLPYKITFNIQVIKKGLNWYTINAPIYIYTRYPSGIDIGDNVIIKNINCKKIANKSFEQYLIKEGIVNTVFCNKLSIISIDKSSFSLNRHLHHIKNNLLLSLQRKLAQDTRTLFASLFLGNKTEYKQELEKTSDTFKTWGISHYLARSGLHLIIFIITWEIIFRIIPIYFVIKQLILLIISLLYFLLSWPSLSFMRALYTFILYKFCVLSKRQPHFLHLLTIVCFITLIRNPIQLFFLDFQLSFGLTFALAYFNYNYSRKYSKKAKH